MAYYQRQRQPQSKYSRILKSIQNIISDDNQLEVLLNQAKQHHCGRDHLSGFNGASYATLQATSRKTQHGDNIRSRSQKNLSSYFTDDDTVLDAIYETLAHGRTAKNKNIINSLTGFLARDDIPIGEIVTFRHERTRYDTPYGYTISRDVSAPQGHKGKISEQTAHGVVVKFKKLSFNGDFELYDIYPTPSKSTWQSIEDITPNRELQAKIEASPGYDIMPSFRQIETLLRTTQDDDTPSYSIKNGHLIADFTDIGGPIVEVSHNNLHTQKSSNMTETVAELTKLGFAPYAKMLATIAPTIHKDHDYRGNKEQIHAAFASLEPETTLSL